MSHQHHDSTISTTKTCSTCNQFNSDSKGAGLFGNGTGMTSNAHQSVTSNNNQHLGATSARGDAHNNTHLGATSARDEETLSAGSTARAESNAYRMSNNNGDLEKDFSNRNGPNGYGANAAGHQHLDTSMDEDLALRHIRTAGSISITPELFEKLYLSPKNDVKGELRKTFGNPTPLALIGFLLSLTPLSWTLMGWRGAGGSGSASIGWYFFAGGLLMVLGGVGEWILGNTFPFVVFTSFGAFWLGYAATLVPEYGAYGNYADPATQGSTGLESVGFNVGIAYFMICMGILCLVYLICSLRTNLVFFLIFFTLIPAFALLAGAFLNAAQGNANTAQKCQEAAGAFTFVTCLLGWYIFLAIMLASVDFPFSLPIVDLSGMIKGASEKQKVNHVE
ncbi:GPR1/FUN34/YaaH-class plasma membrane protein [Stagonosporopsis vannaccii]|nr:GPR1/FUN34/YaaH-class plasma membrane protein [Stagonosporopsis vannaccii]